MVASYQPLTDSQWQVIAPLLPLQRKRRHSLRQVFDAMLYICRTGCQWRNLPACFPPWPAVYYYFAQWRASGLFEHLSQASNRADRLAQGRLPTPSLALVDAQSVKLAPRLGQQRGLDAHKRVNGRKRQMRWAGLASGRARRQRPRQPRGSTAAACSEPTPAGLGQPLA